MISSFKLKFGRTPNSEGEEIQATPITIFVGPNNSGKSKLLDEIRQYCENGKNSDFVILDKINVTNIEPEIYLESAIQDLKENSKTIGLDSNDINIVIKITDNSYDYITKKKLAESLRNPQNNIELFCRNFFKYQILFLNGISRIALLGIQEGGDLKNPPSSSFQVLLRNEQKLNDIRKIIYEAFNLHLIIDPTELGKLKACLSSDPPINHLEKSIFHPDSIDFYKKSQNIDATSDGVKAFTGILTQIIAGDPRVLLVDEPEAFLHPALAYKLGNEISKIANKENKRIFTSTHSPNFLMGCIQAGTPINIIRLTYRNNTATARLLPSTELLELMRHPLLRSTGVLSGLFYESIVITESDADRAFYQEVNERLLRFKPEWGIPHCLFINAQNKQTIHTIIRPLRKLGIPAVGIFDIDALKEGGKVWSNLLECGSTPPLLKNSLSTMRKSILDALDATKKNMKRDGGINILPELEKEAANTLLNQLAEYGLFIIPNGELEYWLKELAVTGHGPEWLINIFEKMGSDPESESYVKPTDKDVWEFMAKIRNWLLNPNRKGIPA